MEIAPAVQGGRDDISAASTTAHASTSDSSSSSSSLAVAVVEKEMTNNSVLSRFDEDDEEGDVCRICRNPGDADNPLRYPCACSGSIKFVHQECLLQWLNHSNARQCEVILFISYFIYYVN